MLPFVFFSPRLPISFPCPSLPSLIKTKLADPTRHSTRIESNSNSVVQSKPTRSFEFPDGYNTYLGVPRLSVPEILFNPQAHLPQEVSERFVSFFLS
jgi:hypothetical protein